MDPARLKSVPLFAGLSRRELRDVSRFADEIDFDEGKRLVREGEFAYEFFAILDGTAEVRHGDELLAEIGPGDFFGEVGLIRDARRNADVVTTSPMTAVVMTGNALRHLGRELPSVGEKINRAVEERARRLEPN